ITGHLLGASFFFSRGGGEVSNARKFCTAIAFQLAERIPTLRPHICNAITEHEKTASLSLQDQWRQLVLKPLSKLSNSTCPVYYTIVVDALDECDDDSTKNIPLLLNLLAEA